MAAVRLCDCFSTGRDVTHLVSSVLVGVVVGRLRSGRVERVEGLSLVGLFLELCDAVGLPVAILVRSHRSHGYTISLRIERGGLFATLFHSNRDVLYAGKASICPTLATTEGEMASPM